eukprot:scaffold2065_cov107-Cylindrotheca_fusiformis.AAC.4
MAPIKCIDETDPEDPSDEESYIEEEIVDSDDETVEEEVEEEVEAEEEEFEEEVLDDDDDDEESVSEKDFIDDSSSEQPTSLADSDAPVVEGHPVLPTSRSSSSEVYEAVQTAKAEFEMEKFNRRQAARDALLRETHLQEETLKAMELIEVGGLDPEEISRIRIQKQLLVARRRLAEQIEKMDSKISKKKRETASDQPPSISSVDLEKRKKALAELRRQAAFQELTRNNTKLKAEKAARSVASVSTSNSKDQTHHSTGSKPIATVEVSDGQPPISPLNTKYQESQTKKSTPETSTLAPKSWMSKPDKAISQMPASPQLQTSRVREGTNSEAAGQSNSIPSRSIGGYRGLLAKRTVDIESIPTMFRPSIVKKQGAEVTPDSNVCIADGKYYPLADLQQKKVEGIDTTRREQYLSPEDFLENFSMTKEEFRKLPKWKRDKAKISLRLF